MKLAELTIDLEVKTGRQAFTQTQIIHRTARQKNIFEIDNQSVNMPLS